MAHISHLLTEKGLFRPDILDGKPYLEVDVVLPITKTERIICILDGVTRVVFAILVIMIAIGILHKIRLLGG
jgi:hypothetical protein